jgi:ATP-dependent DNA ligase
LWLTDPETGGFKTPPLYKRTTTGKIQIWYIQFGLGDRYRMVSGQVDGKKVTSAWTVAKPKNTGRSNATTGPEQAVAEVWAAWEKKQRDGYSTTPDAAGASVDFFPMLAPTQSYDKDAARKKNVLEALKRYGRVWLQPKLDGVRCNATKEILLSRKRRQFFACPHVGIELENTFVDFPRIIVDGEFYNHDFRDNFDKIISLVRPQKPTAEELAESAELVEYWIYDVFDPERPDVDYPSRLELIDLIGSHYSSTGSVKMTPTFECTSEREIDIRYAEFLDQGFEGAMIRTSGPYQPGKRSKHLTKRKEMVDMEYKLLDVCEGEGNRAGEAGYVVIELKDKRTQKAGIKGNQVFRLDLLNNKKKYIGHPATIQHFVQLTPDGKLRFPTLKMVYPGGRDM